MIIYFTNSFLSEWCAQNVQNIVCIIIIISSCSCSRSSIINNIYIIIEEVKHNYTK